MSGGYFTRTYELWRYIKQENDYGEIIKEWHKQCDFTGRVYPQRQEHSFVGGQIPTTTIAYTVAAPAETDMKVGDRVRFGDHKLEVQAVSTTSRGDRIEALAKEID
ncbi:hypothetical protein HKX42_10330 [Salinisphaera sp. USBA-960]|nr:hypothetical protein [Salifodinibacter halophilus]NNC27270.1 hypothetical protein [Salifodinibacter halophilus]